MLEPQLPSIPFSLGVLILHPFQRPRDPAESRNCGGVWGLELAGWWGGPAVQSHPISGLCSGDGWWCPSRFSVPTFRHHNQSVEIWVFLSIWTISFLTTFSVGSTYLSARVRWAVFPQMPP